MEIILNSLLKHCNQVSRILLFIFMVTYWPLWAISTFQQPLKQVANVHRDYYGFNISEVGDTHNYIISGHCNLYSVISE